MLETMVAENPHMAGWFADDLGSRSWFPGFDWAQLPGQGGLPGTVPSRSPRHFAVVADEHGLIFLVNGTWSANDGGGYPNAAKSGNALADGGFVEHHDGQIDFFGPYGCSSQWAAQSPRHPRQGDQLRGDRHRRRQAEYVESRLLRLRQPAVTDVRTARPRGAPSTPPGCPHASPTTTPRGSPPRPPPGRQRADSGARSRAKRAFRSYAAGGRLLRRGCMEA